MQALPVQLSTTQYSASIGASLEIMHAHTPLRAHGPIHAHTPPHAHASAPLSVSFLSFASVGQTLTARSKPPGRSFPLHAKIDTVGEVFKEQEQQNVIHEYD